MMTKYKLVLTSWGGTKRDFMTCLTYREAQRIGESYHWVYDAGYIWDMEIEEE